MEAFRHQELFPNAERLIATRTSSISTMVSRVVVTIEPLHHFLFSINSPKLHQRLAGTSWEALYELSWADLVLEVCEAFPSSRVWVITPDAAFGSAKTVLSELFGPAGCEIDPALLQRPHLTPDGQAALASILAAHKPAPDILEQLRACNPDTPAGQATFASILAAHEPNPGILEQLFASHRDTPDPAELEARLGIDQLTSSLLDQRFLEDLREVEALPDVRLLR